MKYVRIVAVLILALGVLLAANRKRDDVEVGMAQIIQNGKKNSEEIVEVGKDSVLPDLLVLPPHNLYITSTTGSRKLRFATTFANMGKADLELRGDYNEANDTTTATQIVQKIDGSSEEHKIGEFVYHPGHRHWHIEKYALFQLWRYDDSGEPTSVVASTDKMSWCIWDEHPYDLTLEGAPQRRQFLRCVNNMQGNSVGWGDTYPASIEGQELNIMGVEDGKYLIRSRVNVDQNIFESDYTNNEARLYVEIVGNRITILPGP